MGMGAPLSFRIAANTNLSRGVCVHAGAVSAVAGIPSLGSPVSDAMVPATASCLAVSA